MKDFGDMITEKIIYFCYTLYIRSNGEKEREGVCNM